MTKNYFQYSLIGWCNSLGIAAYPLAQLFHVDDHPERRTASQNKTVYWHLYFWLGCMVIASTVLVLSFNIQQKAQREPSGKEGTFLKHSHYCFNYRKHYGQYWSHSTTWTTDILFLILSIGDGELYSQEPLYTTDARRVFQCTHTKYINLNIVVEQDCKVSTPSNKAFLFVGYLCLGLPGTTHSSKPDATLQYGTLLVCTTFENNFVFLFRWAKCHTFIKI